MHDDKLTAMFGRIPRPVAGDLMDYLNWRYDYLWATARDGSEVLYTWRWMCRRTYTAWVRAG
jgi:hypothetical protein